MTRRNRNRAVEEEEALKTVKRERVDSAAGRDESPTRESELDRRVLRSKYLAVMNLINEERDDLTRENSDKFSAIIGEVERLHELVQKPREQLADAEALLGIANSLAASVKSHSSEGVTPADFVNCLLNEYGQSNGGVAPQENAQIMVRWKDIGLAVAPIFSKAHGCNTMVGPMNTELKQRKTVVHRRRAKPNETACPEELDSTAEEKTDTDKNMSTMFEILRRKKRVKLESLILDRKSFAQSVENLFALSFLVKDGRAEITVHENGSHLVSPRNAPAANSVMSGEVAYGHFVFRFDFKDWKLMMDVVPLGEELMPHRNNSNLSADSQAEPAVNNSQPALPTTPIRKLSRNRGLVVQKEYVVEESPDNDDGVSKRANAIRRGKRKLN